MSEQEADKQASDAIVAGVAFYAAALARAQSVICDLKTDKMTMQSSIDHHVNAFRTETIRAEQLLDRVRVLEVEVVNSLKTKLERAEQALKTEKQKSNQLEIEKSELQQKFDKQRTENEHVQRALLESHHERDGLRKKVHESGESMGWLKNDANRFVSRLRNMAAMTGRIVDTVDDVLTVISDAIEEYCANHPPVVVEPKKLPTPKF